MNMFVTCPPMNTQSSLIHSPSGQRQPHKSAKSQSGWHGASLSFRAGVQGRWGPAPSPA